VTGGKTLPKEVMDEILARTDGVPLFIEELTKTVLESQLLQQRDGHYVLERPLPSLAIPTTLHASLMARLDRLAPVREVAQIGAVVGREFHYELLNAVAGLPREKLDEALAQLVRSELIFRRGEIPHAVYTFKHALVRHAAYAGLLKSRRVHLHADMANALQQEFPDVVQTQPAQPVSDRFFGQSGLREMVRQSPLVNIARNGDRQKPRRRNDCIERRRPSGRRRHDCADDVANAGTGLTVSGGRRLQLRLQRPVHGGATARGGRRIQLGGQGAEAEFAAMCGTDAATSHRDRPYGILAT
jgi:hypothetical protein